MEELDTKARASTELVYYNCLYEDTIPTDLELSDVYEAIITDDGESTSAWDTDGKFNVKQQLRQHFRAHQYLNSKLPVALTIDQILKAHQILMQGSFVNLKRIKNGEFRQCPVTAGPHIFPPFEEIEERLLYVVYTWNARRSTTTDKAVESAAQFFFDVVNLHPFVDGNGRLSRLLASHVIRQLGLPILLRIDNGLKTGREDYLHAVTERSGRAIRELFFASFCLATKHRAEPNSSIRMESCCT